MALIGYARVSTTDQDCAVQEATLLAAGCFRVHCEKRTGTTTEGRDVLTTVLNEILRPGDTLLVTRIDRLARSLFDLERIVRDLTGRGVDLKATEQPIDTSSASGRAFLQMLGVFAEFETALRKERQLEGIAKAKAENKYKGRKPTARAQTAEVRRLAAEGVGPVEIGRRLGIGRTSVWRALREAEAAG